MKDKAHLCQHRFLVEKFFKSKMIHYSDIKIYKENGIWYYSYWDADFGVHGSTINMIVFACPLCGVKLE